MNIETLAANLNVTVEDINALIEGSKLDQDEFCNEDGTLHADGIEILTEAVKTLA